MTMKRLSKRKLNDVTAPRWRRLNRRAITVALDIDYGTVVNNLNPAKSWKSRKKQGQNTDYANIDYSCKLARHQVLTHI